MRTTDFMRMSHAQAAMKASDIAYENEQLRQQLEMAEACLAGDNALIVGLKNDIAEKDAEIAQLRLARDMLYSEGCEKDAQIEQLLEYPYANKALESLIAKAGEVMRERCAVEIAETADMVGIIGHSDRECLQVAIRALPGVTLEDLK